MILRPYQVDIIAQARTLMSQGCRSILIQSPTGSGKTLLTASMLSTAASKQMDSWFVVHRRELIKQSVKAFDGGGVFHGVVAAGFPMDTRPYVQIPSISTLANRYQKLRKPKLIIYDECHHVAAGQWSKIFHANPQAFHIGLTATPERLDGKGLGDFFKAMINGPAVRWLIDNGHLSDYKAYAPNSANISHVHTRMGDFVKSELASILDKPTITGDAIREYQRFALDKRNVVFCVSVEHSKHVVEQYKLAGIPALHVDGESDPKYRDDAIKAFAEGHIKILSNVELFGEGFDLPAIECVQMLRPTQSLGLYLQQVGRSLRPSAGKTHAIILDHAGNIERHGLPDQVREWSLEGRDLTSRKGDKNKSVKVCSKCFAAQMPGRFECMYCREPFELNPRKVAEAEGDLEEISESELSKRREMKQKKEEQRGLDYHDLVALGKKRNYKAPEKWAALMLKIRQQKKMGK